MPGLHGIIGGKKLNAEEASSVLARMNAPLRHYPDYVVTSHHVAEMDTVCGLVSLPARDKAAGAVYRDEKGLLVVLDGEIVNAQDLRERAGIARKDAPDGASLIGAMYRRQGDMRFVSDLEGWFNTLLVDPAADSVFLANDRFGIRPLYYADTEDSFVFAGEVKGVLPSLPDKPELDESAVADLFVFDGPLNDRSLFKGVRRLPSGSIWSRHAGAWERRQYWSPRQAEIGAKLSLAEARDRAVELMPELVARHIGGDYLLSLTGGNDTRVMASVMKPEARPTGAFTYGLTPRTADIAIARRVARVLGVPHEAVILGPEFMKRFPEYAEKAVWLSDGMGDILSASILHVHAGHRNAVVAGGKYGTQIARGVRQKVWQMSGLPTLSVLSAGFRERVRGKPEESLATADRKFADLEYPEDASLLFTIIEECRHHWGGKLAMENALIHVRTPFLDRQMIDFALRLPVDMTSDAALEHHVVRQFSPELARVPTNRGLLPLRDSAWRALWAKTYKWSFFLSTVCNSRRVPPVLRLDRTFFANNATSKFRTWFRGELRDYVAEIALDSKTLSRPWFDAAAIRNAVGQHFARKGDYSNQINKVISFELFLRHFVDG